MILVELALVIKKIFPYFFSGIFALLLISCNDSPTDLGKNFVDPLDGVGIASFDSSVDSMNQTSKPIKNVFSLGTSARLLLGKAENVEALTMLQFSFSLADTIKEQINNGEIVVLDSWIDIIKEYRFGDSSAAFDYTVYKITNSWSPSTFTADSLSLLQYENVDVSSQRITENDTTYSFHLNTDVTKLWLEDYADTGTVANYGILLEPVGNTQKILGFTAFNSSGEDQALLTFVINKPGIYTDTVFATLFNDISVVKGDYAIVGSENIPIQASLASEAHITFDLNVLPENITINSASLTLTVDTLLTKVGSPYINKLLVFLVADSTKDSVDSDYYAELSRSGATFTGNISNIVRAWNNGVDNQGIIVKAYSEYYGVETFVIRGSNAAVQSERPKLKLVYSRK